MENKQEENRLLERVKEISLDILKAVVEVCEKNDIKYSIAYGTFLGAVRHGGFIPWDDDIDIMMTPEEYDKFIKVCENKLPGNLKIVHCGNNPHYPLNFAKVVDMDTTFIDTDY